MNQICSSAIGSATSNGIAATIVAMAKRRAPGSRARRSSVRPMSGAQAQAKKVGRFVTAPVNRPPRPKERAPKSDDVMRSGRARSMAYIPSSASQTCATMCSAKPNVKEPRKVSHCSG